MKKGEEKSMRETISFKYEEILSLANREFGLGYTDDHIEVIVVNHNTGQIRTLAYCHTQDQAEQVLETCIRYGYQEKGEVFE